MDAAFPFGLFIFFQWSEAKSRRNRNINADFNLYFSSLLCYSTLLQLCTDINAYMLADMAHISGLVAAKAIPSPFEYSDLVTTTTHKSLRGVRYDRNLNWTAAVCSTRTTDGQSGKAFQFVPSF